MYVGYQKLLMKKPQMPTSRQTLRSRFNLKRKPRVFCQTREGSRSLFKIRAPHFNFKQELRVKRELHVSTSARALHFSLSAGPTFQPQK